MPAKELIYSSFRVQVAVRSAFPGIPPPKSPGELPRDLNAVVHLCRLVNSWTLTTPGVSASPTTPLCVHLGATPIAPPARFDTQHFKSKFSQ
jgi:hypothetical protein